MGDFTDRLTSKHSEQPSDPARDLWPYVSTFPLKDAGSEYEQTVTITSVDVAVALGVVQASDFGGVPTQELMLMLTQEATTPESPGATTSFIVSREDLLRHTIGLMQRLIADLGPTRAREVMKSVGGYPIKTRGSA